MIVAPAISSGRPGETILDWSALVDEARSSLEQMSDGGWTDFNAHDPGITILELVAYALTDLGYRANHPIADLMAGAAPLAGPAESLTTRAVSLTDLRRLGLDVAGARNVWIEPSQGAGVRIRHLPGAGDVSLEESHVEGADKAAIAGVHRVLIEKSSFEDLASADVIKAVALRFHAERNLGEDFDSFTILEPQPVVVTADLEIEDSVVADDVLIDIYERLDSYMSPRPGRATVAEFRSSGVSSDIIYDGPMLERGIIDSGAGATSRRTILHLSDVIALLASTAGVRATRRVRLGFTLDEADNGPTAWSLGIDDEHASVFDIQSSRIRLLTGGAVALDSTGRADLAQRFADTLRLDAPGPRAMQDGPLPAGRDRNLAQYRPLRFDLPSTYGVKPGSLSKNAAAGRRASANQLRAYLAILDGLLATFFSQLAGARDLLSPGGRDERSYFAQLPEAPSDEEPIASAALTPEALQALVELPGGASAKARRGRFLGHLLARLGESVPSVPQPVAAGFGGDATTPDDLRLRCREEFLRGFVRLSSGRGSGSDLLLDSDESPLLDRIRLKLGLPPSAADRIMLVEHVLLRGAADDVPQALPLLSAAARPDPYSLQLSFILDQRLKSAPGNSDSILKVIREECPAHLVAYVQWFKKADFDAFAESYSRWIKALRRHRRELLGFEES